MCNASKTQEINIHNREKNFPNQWKKGNPLEKQMKDMNN